MRIFIAAAACLILLCAGADSGAAQQSRAKRARTARKDHRAALTEAARRGDVSAMRSILKKGVSAEAKDATLIMVSEMGSVEPVRVLLAAGANPNSMLVSHHWFATPLGGALRARSVEVIDALISAGAELNPKQSLIPPLFFAVGWEDAGMVEELIARGADVNLRNVKGKTALMIAAMTSRPEVVKALIDAGADVNMEDDEGDTALELAEKAESFEAASGRAEVKELLRRAASKRP